KVMAGHPVEGFQFHIDPFEFQVFDPSIVLGLDSIGNVLNDSYHYRPPVPLKVPPLGPDVFYPTFFRDDPIDVFPGILNFPEPLSISVKFYEVLRVHKFTVLLEVGFEFPGFAIQDPVKIVRYLDLVRFEEGDKTADLGHFFGLGHDEVLDFQLFVQVKQVFLGNVFLGIVADHFQQPPVHGLDKGVEPIPLPLHLELSFKIDGTSLVETVHHALKFIVFIYEGENLRNRLTKDILRVQVQIFLVAAICEHHLKIDHFPRSIANGLVIVHDIVRTLYNVLQKEFRGLDPVLLPSEPTIGYGEHHNGEYRQQ